MTKVGNISTMVVSAICLALWVAVTAYYGTWDTSETNWDLLLVECCLVFSAELTCLALGHAHIANLSTQVSTSTRLAQKW